MAAHLPHVSLEPIPYESASVLRNLMELYAHDFSEHVRLDLKPHGRFDVPVGDRWWTTDNHFPFFIRADGKLVGFALVRSGSRVSGAAEVMDVAEFFVIRGARGKKVGRAAAHALFQSFQQPWEIRIRKSNAPAMAFWSRVVEGWCREPLRTESFIADGVEWYLLRTQSDQA